MNELRKKGKGSKLLTSCGRSWERFLEDSCSFPRDMNFWASIDTSILALYYYLCVSLLSNLSKIVSKLNGHKHQAPTSSATFVRQHTSVPYSCNSSHIERGVYIQGEKKKKIYCAEGRLIFPSMVELTGYICQVTQLQGLWKFFFR